MDRGKHPRKDKRNKLRDEYRRTKNWGVSIKKKRTKRTRIWA